MKYKFLEHTADVKFQAYGKSLNEVFENSAMAMKEVMTQKVRIKSKVKKKFSVSGKDNESLMYNFLEQFLYLLDAENFVLSKVKVSVKYNEIFCEVWGDKKTNYKFSNDVKAVTYNQMFVKQTSRKYIAQVVLDV